MLAVVNFKQMSGSEKAEIIYNISLKLIHMDQDEKFGNTVWDSNHIVPQIDLFKIHHFDNNSKRTSLKKLEFNMRSEKIQDLPYQVGSTLTFD